MNASNLLLPVLLVAAAACGGSSPAGGGDDTGNTPDAGGGIDSNGGSGTQHIKIAGSTSAATTSASTPEAGIAVAAFDASDAMVASGTSDGSGNFSLSVSIASGPFTGYIKATKAGTYLDTYLFPPRPLSADSSGATVELLTADLLSQSTILSGVTLNTADAFIGIEVDDAAGMPVAGAKVTAKTGGTANGTVEYAGSLGAPTMDATSTAADGRVFVFNATPGTIDLVATKTGIAFGAHSVKVVGGSVVETSMVPE